MSEKYRSDITLADAENLSTTARMFGVRRARDLKKFPEDGRRPIVGYDPGYYANCAAKVFRRAVKQDPELQDMYLRAWSLSSGLERSTSKPFSPLGPSIGAARQLPEAVEAIHERINAKGLLVPIEGKWLDRACDISAFALSVVSGEVSLSRFPSDEENRGRLFRGLPADFDTNTELYWSTVLSRLQPRDRV